MREKKWKTLFSEKKIIKNLEKEKRVLALFVERALEIYLSL